MGKEGGGMGRIVFNAFNNVVAIVGRLADYFELVKSAWFSFKAAILGGAGAIINIIDKIAEGWRQLANLVPGVDIKQNSFLGDLSSSFADEFETSLQQAIKSYQKFENKINSSKAGSVFEEIVKRADEVAKNANNSLPFSELGEESSESKNRSSFARGIDTDKLVIGKDAPQNKLLSVQKEANGLLRQLVDNTSNQFSVVS